MLGHDECCRSANSVMVLAAADKLSYGSSGSFLHGDALSLGPLAKGYLLVLGESKCHGHAPMVSVRYRPPEDIRWWTTSEGGRTLSLYRIFLEANAMLGEGLTTAAPAQQMKFEESAFDRPRHSGRRRARWLMALGASLIVAIAIIL